MIPKKKILIYDSSRGYSRFIKINFKEFEVNNFSEYSDDINIDNFAAIFFFVNYPIELLDLIRIQSKKTPIFLGTRLSEINYKIKDFDNIIFLDLQQSKKEILDLIKFNFNIYGILDNVVV